MNTKGGLTKRNTQVQEMQRDCQVLCVNFSYYIKRT